MFAETILKKVYDPATNRRKIWKFRYNDYSYGGVISMDIMGCSFRCDYCWVDNSVLTGGGGIVKLNEDKGKNFYLSPEEAFAVLRRYMERYKLPSVQITGGETFLAPRWTLEVLKLLCKYFKNEYPHSIPRPYKPGVVWIDTQGVDLMRHEADGIFEKLAEFRDHLRLFISLKAHPRDFVQRTGVDASFADVGFQVLERAWRHHIIAIPQMLDGLFYPDTAEWFLERLKKIHPNGPRILQVDKLRLFGFLPGERNVGRMKKRGFRFGKDGDRIKREQALATWRAALNRTYGNGSLNACRALLPKGNFDFDCDKFPSRTASIVEKLIFQTPELSHTNNSKRQKPKV